jgi:hypothetical protein
MNENEPSSSTKHVLDTINSLSWFAMDASWMLGVPEVSLTMIVPTMLSGFLLCFMEKKRSLTLINVAILSWICMNVSWMGAELLGQQAFLNLAKGFFGAGLVFIALAVRSSRNISETFSHFKRFRIKKFRVD